MKLKWVKKMVSGVLLTMMVAAAALQTGCSGLGGGKSAQEVVKEMGVGFNIGNSLDSVGGYNPVYQETTWGNVRISQEFVSALKDKGFTTVRIPCTWFNAITNENGTYTINTEFMDRVQEVVDYAYKIGMYVILNTMHEDFTENKELVNKQQQVGEELSQVWDQIANRFANYDYHLIFESMNEPRIKGTGSEWSGNPDGNAAINYLNQVFVNTIRGNGKGNNKTRCLMVPGYAASSGMQCLRGISLPTYNGKVCENLIVSVHSYTPYNFCLTDNDETFDEEDKRAIDTVYSDIRTYFLDYGVAVVMGETGATNTNNNTAERTKWAEYFASVSASYGVPVCIWDNGNNDHVGGECHSYIDRNAATWRSEYESVIDAFINGFKDTEWGKAMEEKTEPDTEKQITYLGNGKVIDVSTSYITNPSYYNMTFDGWYTTPTYEPDSKLDISKLEHSVFAWAKYNLDTEAAGVVTK